MQGTNLPILFRNDKILVIIHTLYICLRFPLRLSRRYMAEILRYGVKLYPINQSLTLENGDTTLRGVYGTSSVRRRGVSYKDSRKKNKLKTKTSFQ